MVPELLDDPVIAAIAERVYKTSAQVALACRKTPCRGSGSA